MYALHRTRAHAALPAPAAPHLRADHGHCFALRGVDLARHDGGAGLVLRQTQLAQAAARAGAQEADVVGHLHERHSDLQAQGGRAGATRGLGTRNAASRQEAALRWGAPRLPQRRASSALRVWHKQRCRCFHDVRLVPAKHSTRA